MDDIQSWSEVPSIAHFCSLFRAAFNLLDFDIEELEEALLTDGAEDTGSSLLQDLIVRLLCGCVQSNEISTFNYQMFLRRLFRQKCHEYGRENPFNTDIDFQFLPLRTKVEILHALCDFRLDADDVQDLLKNLESDSLRVEPLGHDENKSAYWYFYGTRLYREDFPKNKNKIGDKRRKTKEEKRKRKKNKTSYESDIEDDIAPGIWQVVCYTEEDWEKLALKFKGSTCKDEKDLHRTLTEDFLPEIPRLFAEKERLQKKRMMEYQPRRQSSRLEKLKQKEEEEKILAREEEEKLKLEMEERDRRERLMARTMRAFQRGSSWSGSECGSYASEREQKIEDSPAPDKSHHLTIGRQTNNSLASATGQIIIQPPRRKKLRSKQVFRTSAEDLRTGMYKILEYIKNHDEAWPFVDPVDENYAPRYYSVIRKPMDLQRMENKLDAGEYLTFTEFRNDFQLIVDNCRQYNGSENEYTEMVRNLQDAFQEAVDRYLESDPSSDEEVAVEYPTAFVSQKVKEHGKKIRRLKRKEKDQIKDKENKKKKYESDELDSKPPSLKPQRIRSPLSEKSGSVPGSDFDDREPDFLREPSPPRLYKESEMDMAEDSSTDSRSKLVSKPKSEKSRKGTGVIRNVAAIEALSLATEQTLKDINKWLDDTPRYTEFSSPSNSPSHALSSEEFDNGTNRSEIESRKATKVDKCKIKDKDAVKKKKNFDSIKPKRKEIQRTIERLQPGKSKGNLITNLPKSKENVEESGMSIGFGLGKLVKESRNALLVKTDETAPKLSLGTVLKNDIIGFGKSKYNFDEKDKMKKDVTTEDIENEVAEKKSGISKGGVTGPNLDQVVKRSPDLKSDIKNEEYSKDKENDYLDKAKGEDLKSQLPEENKRVAVKEITNKAKPTPNLSAWFKAFGSPKAPSVPKKKTETNDATTAMGRTSPSPSQESRSELLFKSVSEGKEKNDRTWYQDGCRLSPNSGIVNRDRIEAPANAEMEEPKSVSVSSPLASPDIRPESASSLVQPLSNLIPAPRQRKASTSSSMSERSSFSQDPMDGSSPHLSMDERLGGYSVPYPSPLHRSPIAASPVMASPKGEDLNKNTYASINGTIRVGFYQDTSSNFQKSSPEKQSPNSNSPRDQSNSSPFQTYPSHVYPPTVAQSANITNIYGQTSHSAAGNYSSYTSTSANTSGLYDNLSQYSLSPMVNYADQSFRSTKPQENYNFSPRPTVYSNSETVTKPPSSVFPVKKRLYAEIEAGRLQIPNEMPKVAESQRNLMQSSSQYDGSGNRNVYSDTRDNSLTFSTLQRSEPSTQQYDRYPLQTSRIHPISDAPKYQQNEGSNRMTCDLSKHPHTPAKKVLEPDGPPLSSYSNEPNNSQSGEVENLSRFHQEMLRHQLPADYSKLQHNEVPKMLSDPGTLAGDIDSIGKSKYGMPGSENTRGLDNIMDNLGRLQTQPMTNSVTSANRGCYTNPMDPASLGRLIQPPVSKSTITEDSDGVFRNKYAPTIDSLGKFQQPQQNFCTQDDGKLVYGPSANLGRMPPSGNSSESRSPCPASYQSPMDASLRQNLSTLSHAVDRFQAEERLMQQSAYFSDKNLANIYSKSVSDCGAVYSQSVGKATNPSITSHTQVSFSKESDLNIPKPGNFAEAKKNRKKPAKNMEMVATNASGSGNTAFQQYIGLKSNEPPAISLKTASVLPGSAFNFGPSPTSLGLPNTLYSEKDAYSGFLDDFRPQPSTYYSMVAAAAHHRSTPDPSAEKPAHSSGSGNTFTFLGHPQTRASNYPALPQFVNPHQAGLMDPGTASSPLYQQYIQGLTTRLQEEQLRHSGVLHQGLLGPSSSYPSGYHHPALGIPRQPYDRPSWL